MGILKVEIDYRDIACNIVATKNAAKKLIESCDKMQINLDKAVFEGKKMMVEDEIRIK